MNDEVFEGHRTIEPFNYAQGFAKNKIKTSKYAWWTFLPKNLVEQFSKFANCYFLLICVMQTIPLISITNNHPTTLLPLTFVLLLSMTKDLYEDLKRSNSDKLENNRKVEVFLEG